MSSSIAQLLSTPAEAACSPVAAPVTVQGWIRTSRFAKRVTFLHLSDGSPETLQIVIAPAVPAALRARLGIGAAVRITGVLVPSRGAEQALELKCAPEQLEIVGDCDPAAFPVQKKAASPEFWRTIPHLRARTATFQHAFRARNALSMAVHRFLQERGFLWVHTPLITHSDCEGAGETFHVATPDRDGRLDASAFFGRTAYLTVSGQLQLEAFACALSRVYTFGPCFRAEDSHTSRHAAEFWMVEPELAFADLQQVLELACELVVALARELGAEHLVPGASIPQLPYTEAVQILVEADHAFAHPIHWGLPLKTEHERYLAEVHVGGPVLITHHPADTWPFYTRLSDPQERERPTVDSFDLLVPGVGELLGGSAREERLELLVAQMQRRGLDPAAYDGYLDLRRFGSVPHGGFGLGLERALMWLTGADNIRDVLPFPRTRA